jgi:hypothetical protein
VITLVRYRTLPWNSASSSQSLHYIVVVGTTSRGFFVHDVGAAGGGVGRWRVLTSGDLERAWSASGYPGMGIAIGPHPGNLSLPIAHLLGSEFLGHGPVVFGGNQTAAAGALDTSAPLPPSITSTLSVTDVSPLPPAFAPVPPELVSTASPPTESQSAVTLDKVAAALAPRLAGNPTAPKLSRVASALADHWAHSQSSDPASPMYVDPSQSGDFAMARAATSDSALVLSARDSQSSADHSVSLYLVAFGLGGAILLLKRRDEV